MPSNEDAHPEHSKLKSVRTGFHVTGYLVRTLTEKAMPNALTNAIHKASDALRGNTRIKAGDEVELNVGGQDVKLPAKFMGDKLPKGKTQDQLRDEVQEKINNGERLLHQIESNQTNGPCSLKNMTDLMTYMQAKAQVQGGNFHEGSMSIPDPDNKIKNFLDTCPEAYQRQSSHISEFQNQGDAKGTHRGIDAYGRTKNPDQMLPNNMKTVMYGSMNQDAPGMKMPENRLWLKMEPHGAWAFSPTVNDPNGPQRAANRHDGKAAVGHSLSFMETRGEGSKAGTRKERIPDDIKTAWKDFQAEARQDLKGKNPSDEVNAMLRKGEGLQTARGVRFINDYLNTLKNTPELSDNIREKAAHMQHTLKSRFPEQTMNVRIGNEVILSNQELRPRSMNDIPGPGQHRNQGIGQQPQGIGSLANEAASVGRRRMS